MISAPCIVAAGVHTLARRAAAMGRDHGAVAVLVEEDAQRAEPLSCADACLKATPIENSQLGEHLAEPGWHCHHDHFKDSNPNIEWQATLDQAEKIGLGTRQYELKRVK